MTRLITPSAMAVKLLAHQIQQSLMTIEEFDAAIDQVMKQHPDVHLFTNLRGAGSARPPVSSVPSARSGTAGKMPTAWRRSVGSPP